MGLRLLFAAMTYVSTTCGSAIFGCSPHMSCPEKSSTCWNSARRVRRGLYRVCLPLLLKLWGCDDNPFVSRERCAQEESEEKGGKRLFQPISWSVIVKTGGISLVSYSRRLATLDHAGSGGVWCSKRSAAPLESSWNQGET